MNRSTPVLPVHHQLPEFTQTQPIESVMPSSHLILWHPLLLLPPFPPSFRVFSSESTLHMWWPKYWSFSFSISPLKEIPGLISLRMDWLDLLQSKGLSRVFSTLVDSYSIPVYITFVETPLLLPFRKPAICMFLIMLLQYKNQVTPSSYWMLFHVFIKETLCQLYFLSG